MRLETRIDRWLAGFALHAALRPHVVDVVVALPEKVRDDLLHDPCFVIHDYQPGAAMEVPIGVPRFGPGGGSRSVVLKRTLLGRPDAFIRYVIAHELAHAHLRNAGRYPGEDPEHAADSLAAAWGFEKP